MDESSDSSPSAEFTDSDILLLVHGTFAADEKRQDDGFRWWQRSSPTWEVLQRGLPDNVQMPGRETQLFHWSGANTQSERLKASHALLARLVAWEREGRGYHLVGHSHGGSVIWESLVTAAVIRGEGKLDPELRTHFREHGIFPERTGGRQTQRQEDTAREQTSEEVLAALELSGLRSWTTVGTPFLHILPTRRRFVQGWPDRRFSLAVARQLTVPSRVASVVMAVFSILVLTTLASVVLVRNLNTLIVEGCLGPSLILGILLMVAMTRGDLASSLAARERAGRVAFARHANRWLGLWAETDEAVALLRTLAPGADWEYTALFERQVHSGGERRTTNDVVPGDLKLYKKQPMVNAGLVPRAIGLSLGEPQEMIYLSYNRFIAPRLGAMVKRLLTRLGQGSDIPGTTLVFASPWPIPIEAPPPGLPSTTALRLEEHARANAPAIVPLARQVLVDAALGGLATLRLRDVVRGQIGSAAMVHTSYFDDQDVLDLITGHVSSAYPEIECARRPLRADLAAWLEANTAAVTAQLDAWNAATWTYSPVADHG